MLPPMLACQPTRPRSRTRQDSRRLQISSSRRCSGTRIVLIRSRPDQPLSELLPGGAAAACGALGSSWGASAWAIVGRFAFLPPLLPQPRALVDHECRDYPRGPVADEPRQDINAERDEDCGEDPEPRHAGFPAGLSAFRGGPGASTSLLPDQPLPRRSRSNILRGACWAVVWPHAPTIYLDPGPRATRAFRAS